MTRLRRWLLGALVATALPVSPAQAAPYVVVYKDSVLDAAALTDTLQTTLGFTARRRYSSSLRGFSADLTTAQLTSLKADVNVAFSQADTTSASVGYVAATAGETIPPGLRRIGAATTSLVHPAANKAVAVLDTGIDLANTNLSVSAGTNCVTPGAAPADDNGHGTHVAGVIAARNNGSRVVGVAPGTPVIAVKVLGATRTGTLSQILCGLDWVAANAATRGIKVVNMSIAGSGYNDNNCGNSNADAQHKAICRLTAAGITVVAAAGNNAKAISSYVPAAYPEVLTVTAMTDTDGLSGAKGLAPSCKTGEKDDSYGTFSNFGTTTADATHVVSAPGTCIVSDKPGGTTATYFGTSQAAPHVAGTVALCMGTGGVAGPCASLTPAQVIAKIRSTAQAAATTTSGFAGDPTRPLTGKIFGYLVRAESF